MVGASLDGKGVDTLPFLPQEGDERLIGRRAAMIELPAADEMDRVIQDLGFAIGKKSVVRADVGDLIQVDDVVLQVDQSHGKAPFSRFTPEASLAATRARPGRPRRSGPARS